MGDRKIGTPGTVIALGDEPKSLVFYVVRETRRVAFSGSFAISDMCGEWQSFAGGGPAVN